ncbi:MAG: hypothetical protein ACREIB_14135, partial [Pseudomonadota bacterium]
MSEFYKETSPADLGPLFTPPAFTPLAICPIPDVEALVYGAIRACEGRRAAISLKAVAGYVGCEPRKVQEVIKHLVED